MHIHASRTQTAGGGGGRITKKMCLLHTFRVISAIRFLRLMNIFLFCTRYLKISIRLLFCN
jgi:hypothetical protein